MLSEATLKDEVENSGDRLWEQQAVKKHRILRMTISEESSGESSGGISGKISEESSGGISGEVSEESSGGSLRRALGDL
ncbi:unnamed protein product [Merluccius merluccius]